MDTKKDILSEIDLPGLLEQRAEAAKKQKKAAKRLQHATAGHLTGFWLGGCAMALAAISLAQALPENDPTGMFLLSACVILWLGMWVVAFFPSKTVWRLQDKANAATKHVKDIDIKIAFCHQVLEEAKTVKVQRYAKAWDEREVP